jgi:tRNA nucleotidyltransferase (CCA-adding enzyme)
MTEIVAQGELAHLPAERVWVETEKALREADPAVYFAVLTDCGALAALTPELAGRGAAAMDQLAAAAAVSDDSTLRFAALTHGLEPAALEQLCERLKVPRRHRELALLLAAQAGRAARAATLGSEELLVLLEAAGALRDNGRFEEFIGGAAALAGDGFPADYLRRARERVRDVSAAPFVAEGLEGRAIGEAMEAERLRRLDGLREGAEKD